MQTGGRKDFSCILCHEDSPWYCSGPTSLQLKTSVNFQVLIYQKELPTPGYLKKEKKKKLGHGVHLQRTVCFILLTKAKEERLLSVVVATAEAGAGES